MKTLKRSECAVLPLVLKGKWFDMIASCEKREEYRDDKGYWDKRICGWLARPGKSGVVAFSRGYRKPDMFFVCDYCYVKRGGEPNRDWGEPVVAHWVIGLGERVELED